MGPPMQMLLAPSSLENLALNYFLVIPKLVFQCSLNYFCCLSAPQDFGTPVRGNPRAGSMSYLTERSMEHGANHKISKGAVSSKMIMIIK